MIKERVLYSLRDISIIPTVTTDINSRSQCDPFRDSIDKEHGRLLPLITAPMSCVINESNYQEFLGAGVNCIIPRTVDYETRLKLMTEVFCAFSMREAEEIYNFNIPENTIYKVLIDNANGHMKSHIALGKKLKRKFGDKILIMGGNIANPNTYLSYEFAGFDYVRAGIGGGNCCFVEGTEVTMADGSKKLVQDLLTGDIVSTLNGNRVVTDTVSTEVNNTITINNEISCTVDHEFFVVDKDVVSKLGNKVDEQTIKQIGYFIPANMLDKSKHLLVKFNKND